VVPERRLDNRVVQRKAFTKQKKAHNENMEDVMYRVNFRDANFMKVQNRLQTIDERKCNIDPEGVFEYEKHLDCVKSINRKRNSSVASTKYESMLPSRLE